MHKKGQLTPRRITIIMITILASTAMDDDILIVNDELTSSAALNCSSSLKLAGL